MNEISSPVALLVSQDTFETVKFEIENNDLKLKRSKPIINHKNTLDFCLGKI